MTRDERLDHIIRNLGKVAAVADVAAVRALRQSIEDGRASGALAFTIQGQGSSDVLQVLPREDRDGEPSDGDVPVVWIERGQRTLIGDIGLNHLLALIDGALAKREPTGALQN